MIEWPWLLEIDPPPDPVAVFRHLAADPFALFLDSALVTPLPKPAPHAARLRFDRLTARGLSLSKPSPPAPEAATTHPLGRYSFITAYPFATLISRGERTEFTQTDTGLTTLSADDPFALLQQHWRAYAQPAMTSDAHLPPFQGGVAGYWGYELAHRLEKVPFVAQSARSTTSLPDMALGFYDWVLAWDHAGPDGPRCWLFSSGRPATEAAARRRRAQQRVEEIFALIGRPPRPLLVWAASLPAHQPKIRSRRRALRVPGRPGLTSTFSRSAYLAAVRRVLASIAAGDAYQVNLSQQLHLPLTAHPWEHYQRLRRINPAPFAAYFVLPPGQEASPGRVGGALLSASPERFLRVQHGQVETRPIKGTRPRGRTAAADAALQAELAASAKDQAENVMIVDLLRNDLSKVCQPFSVRVPALFAVESYTTVHHLVSTVVGQLRPGLDAVDLLRACFPGGSITGAPKVRAMQIIASLEPTPRGVYCGALGYLGFDGAFDSSIAIRTAVAGAHELSFGAGGGIVADSDPAAEYAETLHKAAGLWRGLTMP